MISENKRIRACLFDFDGVLADTMEMNFIAWKNTFNEKGIKITREDYFYLEGAPLQEIVEIISKKYKLENVNFEEIINRKEEYFKRNYNFSFYPGVVEFIASLKKSGILIAIVSAARRNRLINTTPKDFLEKFDCIVTGDELKKGKPNPDPYLKAMEKLNVNSEECIVIENAPLGIKSAKKAKIYCIGICSTMGKEHLYEADEIITNFQDLNSVEKIKSLLND